MANLHLLAPEIVLAAMALGLMVADLFTRSEHGRTLYHLAWMATAITMCLVGFSISNSLGGQGLGSLWAVDGLSQFFKMLILASTILALMLGLGYKGLNPANAGTFSTLLLFSTVGMMLLISAVDLLLVFIALELISISSFILTGFERGMRKSNEGALKYFLFGAFSSAIMVYGISFYYGATGGTTLLAAPGRGPTALLGLLFILIGVGFKASIAPMHFWVPDAYEGAPTPVTAFLSIAPKIAAMGLIVRIFNLLIPASQLHLTTLLSVLAALTMTLGNFTALFQTNVKRMLAYSSIAQAGYILIGIVAGGRLGLEGVLLYSLIYVTMNIGAFAVAVAVGNENSYELAAYDGLAQRSLGTALAMTFFLLSLAGIPPLAGFMGKFYLFSAAIQSGHYGLAVVAVVNSVVSVYYYSRIAYHMFFMPARVKAPVELGFPLAGGIAVSLAVVLLLGIYPEPLVAVAQASAQYLP